jgi:hypothetical protein
MPPTFENTKKLFRAGRYVEILHELSSHDKDLTSLQPEHRVLIAHTLLQTGDLWAPSVAMRNHQRSLLSTQR